MQSKDGGVSITVKKRCLNRKKSRLPTSLLPFTYQSKVVKTNKEKALLKTIKIGK